MPIKKAGTPRRTIRRAPNAGTVIRPSDDDIRVRAYHIYLQRNGHPGDPMEDWLRAESELMSAIGALAAVKPGATSPKPASRRTVS